MDFSMSAASFCVELFNYDSLIITLLNRENQSYSAIFPCCDVDFGRHSQALCTFLMAEQFDSYNTD